MAKQSRWDGPPSGIDRDANGEIIKRPGWPKWTAEQIRFADEHRAALELYDRTGDRSGMVRLGLFNPDPDAEPPSSPPALAGED